MERIKLSEENRREISRRCENFTFESLLELSIQSETAAGTLSGGEVCQGEHRTKNIAATTIYSETVSLTWDATASAWYVTTIDRTQTAVEDGLAGDYSAL